MASEIERTVQQGTTVGIDGAVRHCINCGVEFTPALKSGSPIKCEACGITFVVRVIA